MTAKKSTTSVRKKPPAMRAITADDVLAMLEQKSSKKVRDGMSRFAIPSDKVLGVPVGTMRTLAKKIGQNHALAESLWETGVYEARMMSCFLGNPAEVTPAQMDRWCRDFDSWAICDTACFALFNRTPHAWKKISQWAGKRGEFVKRAAFALLASLTVRDKLAADELFAEAMLLIERGATDERNFVKKTVNWALRSIGKRSASLHGAALTVAEQLAASENAAARWVGKDAVRELIGASVKKRLAAKRA